MGRVGRPSLDRRLFIVVFGLGCGLSPFLGGFYDFSFWGPATLILLALLFCLVVLRLDIPSGPARPALAGLVALAAWTLASVSWAESADQALIEASRWILYASAGTVLILLLRTRDNAGLLIGSAAIGGVAVAIYLLLTMWDGNGSSLFLTARLNEPLGYVNGQAGHFLLILWPLVAVAERTNRLVLSGLAIASATLVGALVVLAQTRAVVPAFVVSAAVLLALVPGRARRLWALVAIAAGLAVALGSLLAVYRQAQGGSPLGNDTAADAATMTFAGAALSGCGWIVFNALIARAVERHPGYRRTLRRASAVALSGLALAGTAIVVTRFDQPVETLRTEIEAFVELGGEAERTSRFLSGGGNRYDYWRIALRQFRDHPLKGVGAGNYDRTYFRERRTTEYVRQPHSLELQTLAELGLVGGIALFVFVGAVLVGLVRLVRAPDNGRARFGLAVAAGGAFVAWLVHTSVDWLHLLPGVTGIALASAAALVQPQAGRAPGGRRLGPALVAMFALAISVAAMAVGRPVAAEYYRSRGADVLRSQPRLALARANAALALNDEALPTYYLKGAAYARLDRYDDARGALLEAARREPHDFVPWALMGDLAVQRGELAQAARDYARAARLSPRDPVLAALARDPATAAEP